MHMVSPTLQQVHARCEQEDRAFWPVVLSKPCLDSQPLFMHMAKEIPAADFDALGVVVG